MFETNFIQYDYNIKVFKQDLDIIFFFNKLCRLVWAIESIP